MAKRTRPIDGVQRRYAWRLYPTPAQAAQLREQAMMCADLWNALLEMIETRYSRAVQRHGRGVSFHCGACAALSSPGRVRLCERHRLPSEFDLGNWISDPAHRAPSPEGHLLRDCPEWRALSTWTPRRVATSLRAAYDAFFRRLKAGEDPGYPRYKSRRRHWSIPHRSVSGCQIWRGGAAWDHNNHPDNWSVKLRGIDGLIRARRAFDGRITEWMDVDIIWRDGHWEANAAVAVEPWRRSGGNEDVTVRLDLVDGLAMVNGQMQTPDELLTVQLMEEQYAEQQAEHDVRWPRGRVLSTEQTRERDESRERLARLAARIARKRKNALHCWTAAIIRRANSLTVLAPPIRDTAVTARGRKREIGSYAADAATEMNRVALSYGPAMAVAMLKYKAQEAGVPITVVSDEAAPYLERLAIIAAGEKSHAARQAATSRRKNASKNKGAGIPEHFLPGSVMAGVDSARDS